MRVIAGKAGGIRLKSIKTKDVRPTLDRVKEAVFSMILPYFPFERGLDLYAGFGTLGLEAVSRGTQHLTFIEKNKKYAQIIKENIDKCGFNEHCDVEIDNVFTYIQSSKKKCDLVFMDPPYKNNLVNKTLHSLLNNELLKDGALIIVEHHRDELIEEYDGFKILKDRNYNETVIKVYLYEEE
ncbi:MAG TPA: 16S rRNA (guanine(966)-N(2))-methyltransferase RsmD [Halanaerobiales bacterium]|nr:16S rRNA (guanine(966)-N(2))-methyltransferase RsmD [Halanaerobiales bacterium]